MTRPDSMVSTAGVSTAGRLAALGLARRAARWAGAQAVALAMLAVLGQTAEARDWVSVNSPYPTLSIVRTACISTDPGSPINKGSIQWHPATPQGQVAFQTPTDCLDNNELAGPILDAIRRALPSGVDPGMTEFWQALVIFVNNGNLYVSMFPAPNVGIPLSGNDRTFRYMPSSHFNALFVSAQNCIASQYCLQNVDSHAPCRYCDVGPFVEIPGADVLRLINHLGPLVPGDFVDTLRGSLASIGVR